MFYMELVYIWLFKKNVETKAHFFTGIFPSLLVCKEMRMNLQKAQMEMGGGGGGGGRITDICEREHHCGHP